MPGKKIMKIDKKHKDSKRIPIYIQGLDEHIQGGIPEGSVVLLSGISGTMKSSLCFNIMFNEALKGKNALYVTLEQSSQSLLVHVENLGFDFTKVNIITVTSLQPGLMF